MPPKAYKTTDIVNLFMIKKFVLFSSATVAAADVPRWDAHDFFELQYVTHGRYTNDVDGEKISLSKGEILIIPPNAEHQNFSREDGTVLLLASFACDSDAVLPLCRKVMKLSEDEQKTLGEIIQEGLLCFEPFTSETEDGFAVRPGVSRGRLQMLKNRLEIFIVKLLESRLPQEPKKNPRRQSIGERIYEYLEQHVNDRVLLCDITDEFNLSLSYIKREFKREYGCGITDRFLDMKMSRAKELIEETSLNFTQIAEYLSFESENHFSKTFSKRVGMTPGAYLKKHGGK